MVAFLNAAEIDAQRLDLIDEMSAIVDVAKHQERELSDDESARIDQIQGADGKGGLLAKLDADYARKKAIENRSMEIALNRTGTGEIKVPSGKDEDSVIANIKVPARAKSTRGPERVHRRT